MLLCLRRRRNAQLQHFQLLGIDKIRRARHQIGCVAHFREGNHVAQGIRTKQLHHKPVKPESESPVRRRAVLEGINHEAEAGAGGFLGEAQGAEHQCLHVRAVDTNRAGTQLNAVQHHVIRL